MFISECSTVSETTKGKRTEMKLSGRHGPSSLDQTRHTYVFVYSSFLVIFSPKPCQPGRSFGSSKGRVDGEICSLAAMQHLEWRGHILLFYGIFSSNMRKPFYSRLKRGREGRKERMKGGGISSLDAQVYN